MYPIAMPRVWHEEGNARARRAALRLAWMYQTQQRLEWFRRFPRPFQFVWALVVVFGPMVVLASLGLSWPARMMAAVGAVALVYVPALLHWQRIKSLITNMRYGQLGSVMLDCDQEWREIAFQLKERDLDLDSLMQSNRSKVDPHLGNYVFTMLHPRSVLYRNRHGREHDKAVGMLRQRARIDADRIVQALESF